MESQCEGVGLTGGQILPNFLFFQLLAIFKKIAKKQHLIFQSKKDTFLPSFLFVLWKVFPPFKKF